MSAALRADAFRYRLPLAEPLALPSGTHTEREGVLLRLTDADGAEGWGEAAPLPGYSPDTLADVTAALRQALRQRGGSAGPPSLAWALAQARTDLEATRHGESLAEVYARRVGARSAPSESVALNALLLGSDPLAEAAHVRKKGWRAAKRKVGRGTPEADAALARTLAAVLGPVALRLDANRAWSFGEAARFAEALGDAPIEYVEEPLADPRRLPDLARETGLRYALDESLREITGPGHPAVGEAAAFVVKPMVAPGALAVLPPGAPVVVSGTFESGVGMRHLVALAAALGETPAGLDTYRWLAADVLEHRLPMVGPSVSVREVLAPNAVCLDRLEPLTL